jgi:hypothetical protein
MVRPWIRKKYFHNFHWTKRTSLRRCHEKFGEEEFVEGLFFMLFFLGKEGER